MQPNDYAFDQLMAQRDAAYWAGLSAVVATVALFVSVAGLALIWVQIRANSRAIRIASDSAVAATRAAEAAQADTRAWVQVAVKVQRVGTSDRAMVTAVATNIGRLPALDVRIMVSTTHEAASKWVEDPLNHVRMNLPPLFPGQEQSSISHCVTLRAFGHDSMQYLMSEPMLAHADYFTPGDPDRKRTAMMFEARCDGRGEFYTSPVGWVRKEELVT